MKVLIIAGMTILAQPASGAGESPAALDQCASIGGLAESMMESRQAGVPLSEIIARINKQGGEEAWRQFVREIALDAYGRTPMRTESNARRQRAEFRADWELACYQAG